MASRRLTDEEKDGLLESLVGGVSGVFTDTGLLFTDRAGFIAGEGSDSPLSQAVRAVSRFQCRLHATDPGRYSASEQNYIGDVCGPYLEGIGEDPLPPSIAEPEVSGGQCPGVLYQVQDIGNNNVNGAAFNVNRGNHRGPILSLPNPNPPPNCSESQIAAIRYVVNQTGGVIVQANTCGPLPLVWRIVCTPLEPEPSGGCGDDGPRVNPPTPRPGLPPLGPGPTVNLPGVGDVTVNVSVGNNNEIVIGLPDLGVEGTVNIGGGGGGDDGGGGGGDPTDPGSPGDPVAPGDGEEAAGDADDGEELVGVLVEVLSSPGSAPRFQNNAALPFRGIGYVRMGYPGRLGVDISGGTVISPQFFHAPQRGLTSWAVNANVGFSLRTTPYYRTIDS